MSSKRSSVSSTSGSGPAALRLAGVSPLAIEHFSSTIRRVRQCPTPRKQSNFRRTSRPSRRTGREEARCPARGSPRRHRRAGCGAGRRDVTRRVDGRGRRRARPWTLAVRADGSHRPIAARSVHQGAVGNQPSSRVQCLRRYRATGAFNLSFFLNAIPAAETRTGKSGCAGAIRGFERAIFEDFVVPLSHDGRLALNAARSDFVWYNPRA